MSGVVRLLSRSAVTLHIEGSSVRLLVVRSGEVTSWGAEALEPGLVREGVVVDTGAVAERIRSLFASQRLGRRDVVGALTGQRSVPRILSFPKMERRLLNEAIERQMRREIPLGPEEMHCSWQVIPSENDHVRVFALGVPRDALRAQVEAMTLAGRTLRSLDVRPLALVRAVGQTEAVIANLEPDTIDVVIVQGGIPATIRTVGLEGGLDVIDERVRRLGEEITRTVKFYNDTHREDPLSAATPAYLTGSLAGAAASAGVTEAALGQSPEPLTCPFRHPPDLPLETFAVNIGLALKGTS